MFLFPQIAAIYSEFFSYLIQ